MSENPCGTDASCYLGKFPFFDYPRIPGHELGVEVIRVGQGVQNVKPGDRCSIEPYLNCGECHPCKKGHGNCCENLKVFGVMMDGGLCERSIIRVDKLHPSDQLSYDQLALVETLAIGCHASDRGKAKKGDHALVIGAGPIGLSTIEFNRLTGATLTIMDMSEERLEFCRKNYGIENLVHFKGDGSEIEAMKEVFKDKRLHELVDEKEDGILVEDSPSETTEDISDVSSSEKVSPKSTSDKPSTSTKTPSGTILDNTCCIFR